mgnify:CR=1 FL=1
MSKWVAWLTLGVAMAATAEGIHKWVDAEGNVHYGDRPPATVEAQTLDIRVQSATGKPEVIRYEPYRPEPGQRRRGGGRVTIYTAEWCGICHQATRYFDEQGIRYTEYDVEKSPKGKADFERLNGRGVPIILVNGQKMVGFQPAAFEALRKR